MSVSTANLEKMDEQVEIKISLDLFMPSRGVLYNYYEILKEYGFLPRSNLVTKNDPIQNSSPQENIINSHLII